MSTIVQRLDGTTYDLEQLNIHTIDFLVSSPYPVHQNESVEGRDGVIDLGTSYGYRKIDCSFLMTAADIDDFPLLRNEVFNIFHSKEAFYIIDKGEPGKRWLVKCDGQFNIPQKYRSGRFDVELIAPKGLAESIGTTQDPFTFDSNLWQVGQGLTDEELVYTHATTMFNIYNAGVKLDPRYMDIVIEYTGASTNLSIKNETTGDEWIYTGTSSSGDVIRLDGVRSTKNNLSIFRDTNKKLISLAPGWNGFRLTGTSGTFEIKFIFKFYYL